MKHAPETSSLFGTSAGTAPHPAPSVEQVLADLESALVAVDDRPDLTPTWSLLRAMRTFVEDARRGNEQLRLAFAEIATITARVIGSVPTMPKQRLARRSYLITADDHRAAAKGVVADKLALEQHALDATGGES